MTFWLLTNTTYGTWLPGDRRGSVLKEHGRSKLIEEQALLERYARSLQKSPAVLLDREQAQVLARQFCETAKYRDWDLLAVSIMANHFHLVVADSEDLKPAKILVDFKAYGTRALNRHSGLSSTGTWWTSKGSKRKLPDEMAVAAAINYVLQKQPNPLVTWAPHQSGASATTSSKPRASATNSSKPGA